MENIFETLKQRIKGSRMWSKNTNPRLYIPFTCEEKHIRASVYFELVNDSIELNVLMRPTSLKVHQNICDLLARQVRMNLLEQYRELINNCEISRRRIPLDIRLSDDTVPLHSNSMKHQEEALKFLCSMKVSAFYGDVGVGKSKVVIDLAVSRFVSGKIKKVLVLSPVSLISNFKKEVEKFCVYRKIEWLYYGIDSISMSDRIYLELLSKVDNSTMLIIDEGHYIKSHNAIRSKRVKEVADKCTYKVIMTGTPYSEDISDIFMQYIVLSEDIIKCKTWERFAKQFLIFSDINYNEVVGYKNLDYLTSLIEPYTYYIDKKQCLTLPPLVEKVLSCNLNSNQDYYYFLVKDELIDKIEEIEGYEERKAIIFVYLTLLQQIACGLLNYNNERKYIGTNKFELLDNYNLEGQIVFFCKYLFEVDILVEYLGFAKCAIFTGKNRETRYEELTKFTKGEKQYFVATLSSGGAGINGLQVCNKVIFFSNSFKYSERKQAIGRVERKGQNAEQLHITYLVTDAGIDKKINSNLNRKKDMVKELNALLNDKTKLKNYIKEL